MKYILICDCISKCFYLECVIKRFKSYDNILTGGSTIISFQLYITNSTISSSLTCTFIRTVLVIFSNYSICFVQKPI